MWVKCNPWILLCEFNLGKGGGGRGKKASQQIAVDLFSSFILGYPEWKGAQWMLDIIAREFNMISAARKTRLDKKIHILMIGK